MRRLLIIGCGDVATRALPALRAHYQRIYVLSHSRERVLQLRTLGVLPVVGDLDDPTTLYSLGGLGHEVLHCAPPPSQGTRDTRTSHLIAALARAGTPPRQLVYISTTGVYGDCAGELVSETRRLNPQTDRARRRADAERQLREWGRRSGVRVCVLRAPGIYSEERLPLARLTARTPALHPAEDAYSNHIHAEDLASMAVAALRRGWPGRLYNASDDSRLKMGDYFDLVADLFGLPRPERVSREEARKSLPPGIWSFMNESRRVSNRRIKRELRFALRYPTVHAALADAASVRAL
jgi:nucleoside-diphosphate-sugar epimerase